MVGMASRIILYNIDGEEIGSITVPDVIDKNDIDLELRIGVRLVVSTGRKKRKKTFEIDIRDGKLKELIRKYIEDLELEIRLVKSEEETKEVLSLKEIPSRR